MAELIDHTIEIGGSPYTLPNPRTQLLGRDDALAALVTRILDPAVPLLTVTGPGGVGKTRLALHAAREVRDNFAGEVLFISFADVTGQAWFVRRIAQSLRIPGLEAGFSESALINALADRQLLLVLDNLEQIPEAGDILARLVDSSPSLKVLITSRVAMHLRGEIEFPVSPLALPAVDSHRSPSYEDLARNPAVALFVDRARAVDPTFALTPENAADVGAICARLDGLPLAIELAAARLKLLTPAALLQRLDSRLRILAGGARDLPDRQQNLRQTIAWSYDLLEPTERTAFRALAVFAGGFSLPAAADVLGVDPDDAELLDTLGSLVDQSLLLRIASIDGEPRLTMLETIREFGLEQMRASGEEDSLRAAHALHYRKIAERNADSAVGLEFAAVSDELEEEIPNIHQALDWYLERGEADGAVSIVLAMSHFWMKRGYLVEGSRLMERAVEYVDQIEPVTQVRMLRLSAWFICVSGDPDEALLRSERAVEMARSLERPEDLASALNSLGVVHFYRNEHDGARQAFNETLDVAPFGSRFRIGALNNLGVISREEGSLEEARDVLLQGIDEQTRAKLPDPEAHTLLNLAEVTLELGDLDKAREFLREWSSERGRMRSLDSAASGVWVAARIAERDGDPVRAARLLGWADEQRRRMAVPHVPGDKQDDELRKRMVESIGKPEFERLLAEGRELSLEHVVELTRDFGRSRTAPPASGRSASARPEPVGLDPLTAREIEVARLVAAGRSTRDIAETLFISARTAQTHVTNVLNKLDLESRAALAAWVVRNDADSI